MRDLFESSALESGQRATVTGGVQTVTLNETVTGSDH